MPPEVVDKCLTPKGLGNVVGHSRFQTLPIALHGSGCHRQLARSIRCSLRGLLRCLHTIGLEPTSYTPIIFVCFHTTKCGFRKEEKTPAVSAHV